MTNFVLKAVITIAENIFRYGGMLILVYAFIQWIMAMRDNDGPKHEHAKKFFIAALFSLVLSMSLSPIASGIEAVIKEMTNTLSNAL